MSENDQDQPWERQEGEALFKSIRKQRCDVSHNLLRCESDHLDLVPAQNIGILPCVSFAVMPVGLVAFNANIVRQGERSQASIYQAFSPICILSPGFAKPVP